MRNFERVKAYIDSTAQSVDGWFYPLDMLLYAYLGEIQEESSFQGHLCEVGVWHGKSLALSCLMSAPGEQVFGFDLFVDDCKEKTLQTLKTVCGRPDAAVLVQKNSLECTPAFLQTVLPGPLRFLHVDAGHEFHEALADLVNFGAFMSPTGVIAIDDYYDRAFPGVAAATHAFIEHGRSKQFVPFALGQNKIYLCNPALAGHYQRHLVSKPPFREDLRVQRMYDHPVLIPFAGKLAGRADDVRSLLAP
jgi:hypothetical protein